MRRILLPFAMERRRREPQRRPLNRIIASDWPQAVLFDLDGTLADTLPDIADSLNLLLEENNLATFSSPEVRNMIGGGVAKLVERALRGRGRQPENEDMEALVARFRNIYQPRSTAKTRLFPGALDLVSDLHSADVALGVVTNKPETISRQILDELGVLPFLGAVVGGDTGPTMKPDAGPVLSALQQLGSQPDVALMVGDSSADSGAARAADVSIMLVTFGYSRAPIRDVDADGYVDSFQALAHRLKDSRGLKEVS